MEFIAPVVAIEAVGDWSFTKYVQGHRKNPVYRLFGYVCYIGLLEFFQKAIESHGLSWANSAWDGWSNLTTSIVALFLFGEKPNPSQYVGIVLISLGLFFLGTDGVTVYKK
jgi:multidrug transporter EmrE-like cation transporter